MADQTNISVLTQIFKKEIVLGDLIAIKDNKLNQVGVTPADTDITEKYITTPWFDDLFLVFMYLEKQDDHINNVDFKACEKTPLPKDVDERRTLYYAKFIKDKMELLSFKGFTTNNFVKVRSLLEKVREVASKKNVTDIIEFLNKENKEFNDIITDLPILVVPKTGTWNQMPNAIFGGKNNKSSKPRKYKKNKSSRKH